MMDLKNKSVLVTGAAMGLGKLYAEEFLKRGAKVCLADIMKEDGEKTEETFKQEFGAEKVFFKQADITVKDNLKGVFDEMESRFGQVDVVVNNAGVARPPELCIDLNLKALMWGTEMAIEKMHKQKGGNGGVIINIASMAGIEIHAPISPYYTASKFGVVAASRPVYAGLGNDTASHGIRINTLCPSYMQTNLTKGIEQLPPDHPIRKDVTATGGWLSQLKCRDALMKLVTNEDLTDVVLRISSEGAHLVETHNTWKEIVL